MVILFTLIIISYNNDVLATHTLEITRPCNVSVQSTIFPVSYMNAPRNNPDGSYYPGDAFYYLVQFSASHTCNGVTVSPIISQEGMSILSHNIASWNQLDIQWHTNDHTRIIKKIDPFDIMKNHTHIDQSRYPKYLNTVHYHKIIGYEYWWNDYRSIPYMVEKNDCIFGRAQKWSPFCDTIPILDDTPFMSIREDQSITTQQKKILDDLNLYYDWYGTITTQEWDYTTSDKIHDHQVCMDISCNDTFEDESSMEQFKEMIKNKCNTITVYAGCIWGKIIIHYNVHKQKCLYSELQDMDIPVEEFPENDKCISQIQNIEQTITGLKHTCSKNNNDKTICKSIPVPRTIKLEPDILLPDLGLNLAKKILNDTDGYDAVNLDGTYYLWDPLTIQHTPVFKWKNDRYNTIHFTIEKIYDLTLEKQIQCNSNCIVNLEHDGIMTSVWSLGNGDGITLYNATSASQYGLHDFIYNITIYNNNVSLNSVISMIDGLIVSYDPIYKSYPYTVLSDDHPTSYENSAGIALYYFGSRDTTNYTTQIYENRRSKINDYIYAGFGFDPWIPVTLNNTLHWSMVSNVNDTACSIIPDTLVMIHSGYCIIHFKYPILDTVYDYTSGPIYENITIYNTLMSTSFAGGNTILNNYKYVFPESRFSTNLSVRSIDYDGKIIPLPINVKITPDGNTITNYIKDKVFYDTRDSVFAKIASSVYPVEYNAHGTGHLDVKLRRISSEFTTYGALSQNLSGLDIEELSLLYFNNSQNIILEIPINVGFGALSPVSVVITIDNITKTFDYDYVDFTIPYEIIANMAQNNTLHATRYQGHIAISPSESFGKITKLYVNDTTQDIECSDGCIINSGTGMISVSATNAWGGAASVIVPEFVPEKTPPVTGVGILPVVLFVLILPVLYWAYKYVKNH